MNPEEADIDLSICIANYNGESVLPGCLDSIFGQQTRCRFEVIVHDDASTDGSADYLRALPATVRCLYSETNAGFCVANNRMAAVARGRYLLLMNNDAELLPGALDALLDMAGERDAGIVTLPQFEFESGELFDRGMSLDFFANPVPNTNPQRRDVVTVMGSLLLIDVRLWQQIGGFPEWFGSIGEDLYLCLAARLFGRRILVAPASGYRHRIGHSFGGGKLIASRMATSFRRRALSERNKTFALFLCYPGLFMWPVLVVHLGLLLAEGMSLSLLRADRRYLTLIYFPACAAVAEKWSLLRTLRRSLQRQRRVGPWRFFRGFSPLPYKVVMLFRHGLPSVG